MYVKDCRNCNVEELICLLIVYDFSMKSGHVRSAAVCKSGNACCTLVFANRRVSVQFYRYSSAANWWWFVGEGGKRSWTSRDTVLF